MKNWCSFCSTDYDVTLKRTYCRTVACGDCGGDCGGGWVVVQHVVLLVMVVGDVNGDGGV